MRVSKRKPITEMRAQALAGSIAPRLEQLAEELKLPTQIVDLALWNFIQLSARVEFEMGEVDFELPLATDDAEAIATKFVRFAASECQEKIDQARRAMEALDRPVDPATGPVPTGGLDRGEA